jgi:hypothetical protein
MSAARKIVAVMLGASQFPLAGFDPNAAFAASATAFREYLERHDGAGLTSDRILDLFDDDRGVLDQGDQLIEFLTRHTDATDVVFYYVGHGGFLADREYFLVLRSTKKGREQFRGLRIRALAQLLKEHAPHHRVYLILDCCFAGEAVREFQSGELGLLLEKETFDAMRATGTALLVAASKDEPAITPTGRRQTMFSECLMDVLEDGIPGKDEALSLSDVAEALQARIRDKFGLQGVRPEIHSPRQRGGDIAKLPLLPNLAYEPPAEKALPSGLLQALQNSIPDFRRTGVVLLSDFYQGDDPELKLLAKQELHRLATQDDSLSIRELAEKTLVADLDSTRGNSAEVPIPVLERPIAKKASESPAGVAPCSENDREEV